MTIFVEFHKLICTFLSIALDSTFNRIPQIIHVSIFNKTATAKNSYRSDTDDKYVNVDASIVKIKMRIIINQIYLKKLITLF